MFQVTENSDGAALPKANLVAMGRRHMYIPDKEGVAEWVWDYPVQTEVVPFNKRVRAVWKGEVLAESRKAFKCCDLGNAPVYFLPPQDVAMEWMRPTEQRTHLEWMGVASYWQINVKRNLLESACISLTQASAQYGKLNNYFAFHAGLLDCEVDGHKVYPQKSRKHIGWITPELVGPFKGEPGVDDQIKLMAAILKAKGLQLGGKAN